MADDFDKKRLEAIEAMIEAYEAASLAFASDGTLQSYTLETGANRQTVTRAEVSSLDRVLERLYERRDIYAGRVNGCTLSYAEPSH